MVAHYYRNVSAVVLVYDVMNEQSFHSLSKWVSECANYGLTPEDIPMIVVGNKCDSGNDSKLVVSTFKAQRY
jgi:GTPase SAR1 family protein